HHATHGHGVVDGDEDVDLARLRVATDLGGPTRAIHRGDGHAVDGDAGARCHTVKGRSAGVVADAAARLAGGEGAGPAVRGRGGGRRGHDGHVTREVGALAEEHRRMTAVAPDLVAGEGGEGRERGEEAPARRVVDGDRLITPEDDGRARHRVRAV